MAKPIETMKEDIRVLKEDVEFLKKAIKEDYELSQTALNALKKARQTPESEYSDLL